MVKRIILVRYGEIILKGLNRPVFEDALVKNIKGALRHVCKVDIHRSQANIYIQSLEGDDKTDEMIEVLKHVFGIVSIIESFECEKSMESVCSIVTEAYAQKLSAAKTF